MIKTLTKHGNSFALVIDRPVMDLLHIEADTQLEVSTDGQSLILTPAKGDARKAKLRRALERGNAKYGRALHNLGK
jgi:antitoxin component of MazEF toxin-antitoxin module